jgi:hypothetical protein
MDVGSSNGKERHPTCLFVQVIIGCVTAKAGAWGALLPMLFYIPHIIRIFFYFYISPAYFLLETIKNIGYNTGVYAFSAKTTTEFNERK